MNEQQLAELYSEQIDKMLQGQQPVVPADAADLQPLLTLGQQFSQINFQPSATAQAAFQSQLSTWFGPLNGGTATAAWGLSKTLLLTLTAAVITIGATFGVILLAPLPENWFNPQQQIVPDAPEAPQESLEVPVPDNRQATSVPSIPTAVPTSNTTVSDGDTLSPSSSSKGDTLSPTTSSTGDTLPSTPILGESLPLPTSEPSPTPEVVNDVGGDTSDEPSSDEDSNDSADDSTDDSTSTGNDDDKGHGNDADGIDEDNPGNSSGLPGSGQDSNPGGGPDLDQFSSGGGNNGNGGQGGGSGNNNNEGNRGNSGGQGKGKGKK